MPESLDRQESIEALRRLGYADANTYGQDPELRTARIDNPAYLHELVQNHPQLSSTELRSEYIRGIENHDEVAMEREAKWRISGSGDDMTELSVRTSRDGTFRVRAEESSVGDEDGDVVRSSRTVGKGFATWDQAADFADEWMATEAATMAASRTEVARENSAVLGEIVGRLGYSPKSDEVMEAYRDALDDQRPWSTIAEARAAAINQVVESYGSARYALDPGMVAGSQGEREPEISAVSQAHAAAFTARYGNNISEFLGLGEPAADRVQMLTRGRELSEQEHFDGDPAARWTLQQFSTNPGGQPWMALQERDDVGDVQRTFTGTRPELDQLISGYKLNVTELPAITEGEYYRQAMGSMGLAPEIRQEQGFSVGV